MGGVGGRWAVGLLTVLLVALGGPPAVAGPPVSGPVTHPDDDHAGSSLPPAGPQALRSAPAGQPAGLDVSGHQGAVDWPAVRAAGASFAYVKATEGTGFRNPFFAQQYDGAAGVGLIRGAYHFALPDRGSGAAQANYLLDHGGGWTADGITLPPALDIEFNPYGPTCYGFTPTQLVSWIGEFVSTVRQRIGRPPTIYANTSWWVACTGDSAAFPESPLWIARYAATMGQLPAGWPVATFWQFSDHGVFPGDQDTFNGSLERLRALARG